MALTPTQLVPFLTKNQNADLQASNEVTKPAEAGRPRVLPMGDESREKPCSHIALIEVVRGIKQRVVMHEQKIEGVISLRNQDNKEVLNPNWDAIEQEVGLERQSNPKTNYVQNGGFRVWNAGVTLPLGWTASGSPTVSRVSARTGAQGGNYAARVAAGGSAGSISRTFRVKPSSKYKIAGWIAMAASASVTVTATTDGASPVVVTTPPILKSVNFGTGWLSFPRPQLDVLDIETPADASTITVKLEVDANHTADFSDFQSVQGPRCDADLWEPAPEDIEQITGIGNLPTGPGTGGQFFKTDGAGTTSWATVGKPVIATSTQQLTSQTTLQNDNALLVAIGAGESWVVRIVATFTAALLTTGLKVGVTIPSGGNMILNVVATNSTGGNTPTAGTVYYGTVASSGAPIDFTIGNLVAAQAIEVVCDISVVNGNSAGNIQFQFAQSTSSVVQLVRGIGSSLVAFQKI